MSFKPPPAPPPPPPLATIVTLKYNGGDRARLITDPTRVAAVVAAERARAVEARAVGAVLAVYVQTPAATEGAECGRTLVEKATLVRHRTTPTGPLEFVWRVDKAPEVKPS